MISENQGGISSHDQSDSQSSESPSKVSPATAELQSPPPKTDSEDSRKKAKHWLDYVTFGLELLGFVVLCVYAAYTIRIYCANKKAADAAKRSADIAAQTMRIDERAWVNVSVGKAPMIDNSPLQIPVTLTNDGRTPALNVTGNIVINLLRYGEEPDLIYKKGHPAYAIEVKALTAKLPQNLPFNVLPKYLDSEKPLVPINVTPQLRRAIADGTLYIVVHARLEYDDVFGIHHWIQFCGHASNGIPGIQQQSPGQACGDYNDVDRNL